MEYEKILLDIKNDKLSNKTFTFLDPLTKENLSLRPDITIQLARIASDRLSDFPKPLRLCYYGDVFRADKPKLSEDRQFKQVGVELIGSESFFADIEIIILSLESLSQIGFKEISLDLNIPIIIEKPLSKRFLVSFKIFLIVFAPPLLSIATMLVFIKYCPKMGIRNNCFL